MEANSMSNEQLVSVSPEALEEISKFMSLEQNVGNSIRIVLSAFG